MKNLLFVFLLLPIFATAQTNLHSGLLPMPELDSRYYRAHTVIKHSVKTEKQTECVATVYSDKIIIACGNTNISLYPCLNGLGYKNDTGKILEAIEYGEYIILEYTSNTHYYINKTK
jgi:hypothetical protein